MYVYCVAASPFGHAGIRNGDIQSAKRIKVKFSFTKIQVQYNIFV
jgi:hypothetical protein